MRPALEESDAIHYPVFVSGSPLGPLAGLEFAVKDVVDVAGVPTSAGNDAWARTHEAARKHALVVQTLLDAGANLVGKAVCDELAFSIDGTNPHHGTPMNPAAPGHVPGGSSSGSASAVASGLCDFALGTDTGGSVRVPASYCGVFGLRPTWGVVPLDGVVPLAPSFDTVGWLARELDVMRRVANHLLPPIDAVEPYRQVVPVEEAFHLVDDVVAQALLAIVRDRWGQIVSPRRLGVDLREWAEVRRVMQTFETWQVHGDWAVRYLDTLGPGVRARMVACADTTRTQYDEARAWRDDACSRLSSSVDDSEVLCLPSTGGPPPSLNSSESVKAEQRSRTFALTGVAGMWGAPQLSVPACRVRGLPVGLGLLGRPGDDHRLLRLVDDADGESTVRHA